MSRTYRAKTGDRWWCNRTDGFTWIKRYGRFSFLRLRENDREEFVTWSNKPSTFVKYWESDAPNRGHEVKENTKWQTRRRRRADTRRELNRIYRDVEHDFLNMEKLYKGFIWNWD
jgi:hypothetical protein